MTKTLFALTLAVLLLGGCQTATKDDAKESAPRSSAAAPAPGVKAYEYLTELEKIGPRPSSAEGETKAANWISDTLTSFGYQVDRTSFTYRPDTEDEPEADDVDLTSQNLSVTVPGKSDSIIVVGAHYDSKGQDKGSEGATDNGSGVAALLAVAEALRGKILPDTVKLVFFGAEENGLNGSKAYVEALPPNDIGRIKAMVNFDTIAGGDVLYIHSALNEPKEYDCTDDAAYRHDPTVRDRLLSLSGGTYQKHPAFPGYPEGETGGWSDHAGFACSGIPIAYLEATNFAIDGKDGYDGYSQTTNPAVWDCYDASTKSACDGDDETKWGKIWHTGFDRLGKLDEIFPGRVQKQISDGTELTLKFLNDPGL